MDEYAVFVLKSIWIFILGAGLAVLGLITLLTRPDMGYNPFIIMLMGLFFTGVGSIYGKKKMREGPSSFSSSERMNFGYQGYEKSETKDRFGSSFDQKSQESSQQFLGQQDPTAKVEEQFLELAEDNMDSPMTTKPVQQNEVSPPQREVVQPVTQKPKSDKIIKIIICPKCGSENESDDVFCYKCGKKLLTKKRIAKKSARVVVKKKSKPATKKVVKNVVKGKSVKKTKSKKSNSPSFPGIDI